MQKAKQVIPEQCIGYKGTRIEWEPQNENFIIYALGIGFQQDPLREEDFVFTYEFNEDFQAFPTYGTVVHRSKLLEDILGCPSFPNFNPMDVLHGEHKLECFKPLRPGNKVITQSSMLDVSDKGKSCLITVEVKTYEEEEKPENLVYVNTYGIIIKNVCGFAYKGKNHFEIFQEIPKTPPIKQTTQKTTPNQAFIYRLSGDSNPLHIDPSMANMGGFDKPILHGLCTYGIIGKATYELFCNQNPSLIKCIQARFTSYVFPGETLNIKFWSTQQNQLIFSADTLERGKEVIRGNIELYDINSLPKL